MWNNLPSAVHDNSLSLNLFKYIIDEHHLVPLWCLRMIWCCAVYKWLDSFT